MSISCVFNMKLIHMSESRWNDQRSLLSKQRHFIRALHPVWVDIWLSYVLDVLERVCCNILDKPCSPHRKTDWTRQHEHEYWQVLLMLSPLWPHVSHQLWMGGGELLISKAGEAACNGKHQTLFKPLQVALKVPFSGANSNIMTNVEICLVLSKSLWRNKLGYTFARCPLQW